ncbi:hypothetical protein L211DRAFT_832120 [Terfezia boudieri ATCC MYA-4762]|uniref:Uncharacterized protein n=1 Tax=Terfezia boudieri ATCC MYA-4762 TaxID=1051890 RepID=A0A3N4M6J1_9PEZI|nr:hypothetical protein L211DRAFT_832120 [Terfezia boudieri ATCC MYA-4762]
MSFIVKRGISTLIPPKMASPAVTPFVVDFYTKLPKKTPGLLGGYQDKCFGKNASGMPIVHVIVGIMAIGYAQAYNFHMRMRAIEKWLYDSTNGCTSHHKYNAH